ncbi:PPE domain-containing protein [Amycolatopsis cihanbeyliensis]|uniref:PPE family protein n=1 Tax=Amycolatopsis cihanbeyliensis TaxID=1128664 RepID=A0A542DL13_AMYCI|nr:PPE domain-containing protein [Amycolatopsis cihanbeyliensis]TQJ03792.1 PPE family protein [Amycolatopsis cihanbeyliensis]
MPEEALTPAQIYQQVTGGAGTERLSAAQEAAAKLRRRLEERADRVMRLGGKVQEGWQGEAGEAAANAASPLARAAMQDADHLAEADSGAGEQAGAFDRVRSTVVPVPPKPPELTPQDVVDGLSTGDFGAHSRRLAEYNAGSQTNVAAFGAYHQASTATAQTYPAAYAPMADPGGSVGLTESGTGGTDSGISRPQSSPGPVVGGSVGASGGAPRSTDTGSGERVQPPPTVNPPGDGGPSGPAPSDSTAPRTGTDSTRAAAASTPPPPVPGGQDGYRFGPTGTPVNNLNTNTGAGPHSGTTIGPIGTGTENRAPGTGGYRSGGGPGAGGPGAGRPGAGPGGGRFTGALPPGEGGTVRGGASGTPGAAGTRGTGAMPMGAGAGRGRGAEDEERKRPDYLKDPDPDDTYGGTEGKTVPPVIGESRPGNPAS